MIVERISKEYLLDECKAVRELNSNKLKPNICNRYTHCMTYREEIMTNSQRVEKNSIDQIIFQ